MFRKDTPYGCIFLIYWTIHEKMTRRLPVIPSAGKVYEQGTFSVKNGQQKGKGLDLRAEPLRIKLCRVAPCLRRTPPPPHLSPPVHLSQ